MTLHRFSAIQPITHRTGRLASILITAVAIAIALGSSTAVMASDDHLTAYDTDGDGLPDLVEVQISRTNPLHPDSDRDGISDGDEVLVYRSNPLDADTDGDGVIDGDEVRLGTDPLQDEQAGADPLQDEQAGAELAGLQSTPARARAFSIAGNGRTDTGGRLPTISISAPENRSLREVETRPGSSVSRIPLTPAPQGFD
jgi:hypothetical protein